MMVRVVHTSRAAAPSILAPMTKRYALVWLLMVLGVGALGAWVMIGKSYVRRRLNAPLAVDAAFRTQSQFIALVMPRITLRPHRYGMSAEALSEFLAGLRDAGYTPVGLEDVARLFSEGRRLPPKSVLLAFAQDDGGGLAAADTVLRGLRWRGVAFLTRTAGGGGGDERRFLTEHAVRQMRDGGTWEFGRVEGDSGLVAAEGLRFTRSELGLNEAADGPEALKALALRPERGVEENWRIVENSWPRTSEFKEDFSAEGKGGEWIAGWGVISMRNGRLVILPTPRQSGAGVFIRGTERWRDQTLEFKLEKYRKEFWAYARYQDDDRYVRVGSREGYWYVEQKVGAGYLPNMLARSEIRSGSLPAHVRLVLKGGSAIVHVNGRMQFGKALRIHRNVDRGQVLLGVYDPKTPSALAVLTSVRAAPLSPVWLAPKRDAAGGFAEADLEALREEAVRASAVSPAWLRVSPDGTVSVLETQGLLVRSLAGFYGCRLMPAAEFSRLDAATLGVPENRDRLVVALTDAASALEAGGINVRLRASDAEAPEGVAFLAALRGSLRAQKRALVLTLEGPPRAEGPLRQAVDELLRPSPRSTAGFDVFEAVGVGAR